MSGDVVHQDQGTAAGDHWLTYGPVPGAENSRFGFSPRNMARLDEALTLSSRETGLTFSLYIGSLTEPTRDHAEDLFTQLVDGQVASPVLVAVSPGQRVLQIVTGEAAAQRLPNRACALAALGMRAAFTGGDLTGGIVTGLRMLADSAGSPRG